MLVNLLSFKADCECSISLALPSCFPSWSCPPLLRAALSIISAVTTHRSYTPDFSHSGLTTAWPFKTPYSEKKQTRRQSCTDGEGQESLYKEHGLPSESFTFMYPIFICSSPESHSSYSSVFVNCLVKFP